MKPSKISESTPIQVYLSPKQRALLDRLAEQLDTSKSDILRRGLMALEREITNPDAHPALRLIGLSAGAEHDPLSEVAAEHDRFLAESEEGTWPTPQSEATHPNPKQQRHGP